MFRQTTDRVNMDIILSSTMQEEQLYVRENVVTISGLVRGEFWVLVEIKETFDEGKGGLSMDGQGDTKSVMVICWRS